MTHGRSRLAANIRKAMREKGMSQARLAAEMGTSQAAVCRWCTGDREPKATSVARIASALGCTPNDLLEGVAE